MPGGFSKVGLSEDLYFSMDAPYWDAKMSSNTDTRCWKTRNDDEVPSTLQYPSKHEVMACRLDRYVNKGKYETKELIMALNSCRGGWVRNRRKVFRDCGRSYSWVALEELEAEKEAKEDSLILPF